MPGDRRKKEKNDQHEQEFEQMTEWSGLNGTGLEIQQRERRRGGSPRPKDNQLSEMPFADGHGGLVIRASWHTSVNPP